MPQISLTIAIIISAAALAVGFLIAFLIQNAKISALKNENGNLKTEKENVLSENDENRRKNEKLLFEISEKDRELAVKETILKTETFRANEAERKNVPQRRRNFRKNFRLFPQKPPPPKKATKTSGNGSKKRT